MNTASRSVRRQAAVAGLILAAAAFALAVPIAYTLKSSVSLIRIALGGPYFHQKECPRGH